MTGPGEGDGADDSPQDGTASDGFKFDAGSAEEGGAGGCGCGTSEWSYIWIANPGMSTVSKINTRTMEEEGRYLTREDGDGDPSRTSVSLSGRRVAVANRAGGLVSIWARTEFCDPMRNGTPGLQTSSGSDVLPWGEDDCVAWFTAFDYPSQRPVAWMAGKIDASTCEYSEERVWTSGYDGGGNTAHRLDGATGEILDTVAVPGLGPGDFPLLGGYGGAVDGQGNFYISVFGQASGSNLARVDAETLEVEVWAAPIPGYGITVDRKDRVWLSSTNGGADAGTTAAAARFDPSTGDWATVNGAPSSFAQTGIQIDVDGRAWVAYWSTNFDGNGGLVSIDTDTMEMSPKQTMGMDGKGISIDVDGNVWVVGYSDAIRYNPDTGALDTVDIPDGAYSYSDMTGWALLNATCTPEG